MKVNTKNFEQIKLNYVTKVIKAISKDQHAWPFAKPVDVKELNLVDYYDIIQNPMDLSTIRKKLETKQYTTVLECIDDVTTMFSNCCIYNIVGDVVVSYALKLEARFNFKMASMPYEPPKEEIIPQKKEIVVSRESKSKPVNKTSTSKPISTPVNGSVTPKTSGTKEKVVKTSTANSLSRRESTRTIKRPKNDNDLFFDSGAKKTKLNDSMKAATIIMKELMSKKHAEEFWHFYEAVDTNLVKDYLTIIEKPMDFGTINNNIVSGYYTAPRQFVDDVRLVFTNCYRYNEDSSMLVKCANKAQNLFEYRLSRLPNLSDFLALYHDPNHGLTNGNCKPKLVELTDEGVLKLSELQKNLTTMTLQISQFVDESSNVKSGTVRPKNSFSKASKRPRTHSASGSAKKQKVVENGTKIDSTSILPVVTTKVITPDLSKMAKDILSCPFNEDDEFFEEMNSMTYEEKRTLSLSINTLPGNNLSEVLSILKIHQEKLKMDADEVEIDFESLKPRSLRDLTKYMIFYNKKMNKPRFPRRNYSSKGEADNAKKEHLEQALEGVNTCLIEKGGTKLYNKKAMKSLDLSDLSSDDEPKEPKPKSPKKDKNGVPLHINNKHIWNKLKSIEELEPQNGKVIICPVEDREEGECEPVSANKDQCSGSGSADQDETVRREDNARKRKAFFENRRRLLEIENSKMDLTKQEDMISSTDNLF